MSSDRLTIGLRGVLMLGFVAALALLAWRVNGSNVQSFDGSVVLHHVGSIGLIDDMRKPIDLGPSTRGTIVVLGYTRCTDECPLTLARIAAALSSASTEPLPKAYFVTVDPGHDDPPTLRRYLSTWHHRITGVTAERAALRRLYVALGSADPGSLYGNHDTRVFVLNANGDVVQELSPQASPEDIRRAVLPAG